MKIIVDRDIKFIKGVLDDSADIEYIEGSRITSNLIKSADALLIRTRTKCDRNLLEGSNIRFIGTTTIGTDHIDMEWCRSNGIRVVNAPGSNSGSVMQYLASSLVYLIKKYNLNPGNTTLGVIGVGNIGSVVAALAHNLGFNILLNDPPRQRNEGKKVFIPIQELLNKSDIISLHTPLNYDGIDITHKMVNADFISSVRKGAIIINTSRGAVIEEDDLLASIKSKHIRAAILDVWNKEPDINHELLRFADIGTPHIAGYSEDGKAKGSMMVVRQLARYFDLPLKNWYPDSIADPEDQRINIDSYTGNNSDVILNAIEHTYRVNEDSQLLKNNPENFEQLRTTYGPRREFHAYKVRGKDKSLIQKLKTIGFKT